MTGSLDELKLSLDDVKKNAEETALVASQIVEERNRAAAKFDDEIQRAGKMIEELKSASIVQERQNSEERTRATAKLEGEIQRVNSIIEELISTTAAEKRISDEKALATMQEKNEAIMKSEGDIDRANKIMSS